MSIEKQLLEDYKTAMKSRDKVKLETIRGLRAQIKNDFLDKRGTDLPDADVLIVLERAAKKRREAIEQFKSLGREDRAEEESQELSIIEAYLPEKMDENAVAEVIAGIIEKVGAESAKDMGKVMGVAMAELKGKADGKMVQKIVREKLTAI